MSSQTSYKLRSPRPVAVNAIKPSLLPTPMSIQNTRRLHESVDLLPIDVQGITATP